MMGLFRFANTRTIACVCVCVSLTVVVFMTLSCDMLLGPIRQQQYPQRDPLLYTDDEHYRSLAHSRMVPLIFIGGMPRSGTTLMRVLLDAHPDVRCGEETRVIPRILGMRTELERAPVEKNRLEAAGVTGEVLDSAVRAFILEIVTKHGPAAPRLCNKDPFTLKSTIYLSQQFPRSKFILMIRDGRAVVHSIITRNVTIRGLKSGSWPDGLNMWNKAVDMMYAQCLRVGRARCLPVYYEQLVLQPRVWMERVLTFLDLAWSDNVMHHQDFIGEQISLSRVELSSDQVMKAMYRDSLSSWVDKVPANLRPVMSKLAPMLAVLGYDPRAYPPDYAHPPEGVANNTLHVTSNSNLWKHRPLDPFDPDKQGQENSAQHDLPPKAIRENAADNMARI